MPSSYSADLTLNSALTKDLRTDHGFVEVKNTVELIAGSGLGGRKTGEIWGYQTVGWAFITSLQAKRGWMRVVQIILLAAALVSVPARARQRWWSRHDRRYRTLQRLY